LLTNWTRNAEIVLEANKKFWGKKLGSAPNAFFKQNVGTIRFVIFPDDGKIRSAIFKGNLDMVVSVPPKLYFELSEIPKISENYTFHAPPEPSYEYVAMNMKGSARGRAPVFEDAAVRKATAHLAHVELLLEQVRFGLGERIAAEFPADRDDFRNTGLDLIRFDPAKARTMLETAGWADSDENGLLDKNINGEVVQFVVECIYNENRPQRKMIAEELQKAGMKAGVLISVVDLPWQDYVSRLKGGDFDLAIGAWVSDPNEDSYAQIWHSAEWGAGSNFVGFGNPDTDALVEAYDQAMQTDARRAISKELQQHMYDEQPYIFLWRNTHCIVVHKRFQNAKIYNQRPGFWIGEWE
ncbi:MAG: ABC transporter substrate-binding protein, partial [Bacteroidota bacterium]